MSPVSSGILSAFAASLLYSIATAMSKTALAEFHVLQVLFFRQCVVLMTCLPGIVRSAREIRHPAQPALHGVRLLAGFSALTLSLLAVQNLPLATATVVMFSQVFFVVLLGKFWLGETVTPARLALVALGFVGVVIVLQPDASTLASLTVLVPLGAALSAAIAGVCVRQLAQTNSTGVLLTFQAVFVGLLSGASLFWVWKTPDAEQVVYLFLIGVFATIGQWQGVRALRLVNISLIAGVENTKLLYAGLIGFIAFNETPDRMVFFGSALILLAAYLTLVKRR